MFPALNQKTGNDGELDTQLFYLRGAFSLIQWALILTEPNSSGSV